MKKYSGIEMATTEYMYLNDRSLSTLRKKPTKLSLTLELVRNRVEDYRV